VILQAEIQILFLGNVWIFLPLPSLIYVPKGYQVQGKYFGCSYHIFYLLFLESQQIVSPSFFYNNVHASHHLYGHTLQTHLTTLLSFEPSLSWPVLMTMMNRHESLPWLLALSHLHTVTQNPKICCTLAVVQCTFFQSIFCVIIASFV
jgi:hypothetical protein